MTLDPGLRSLLVVMPSWVGDIVMATPVLRALREHLQHARLATLVRPGHDGLLAGSADVDAVLTASMRGLLGPWIAGRRLHRERFDAALLLPNSFRSALTVRLSGVPVRAGYARDGRGALLTHRLTADRAATPTPTVDHYARLGAWCIGAETIDTVPHLTVTDDQVASAQAALGDLDAKARIVLLVPGGNRADKRWPPERFARVADALHDAFGTTAVVSGAPRERATLDAVVRAARMPVLDLSTRRIDLGALKAVIGRATLVVTNDTGPRHIAAALGTPTVAIFGPTDHRWTTLPVTTERIIVAEPFLPEDVVADRVPAACAVHRIPVEDVLFAARDLLSGADSAHNRPSS